MSQGAQVSGLIRALGRGENKPLSARTIARSAKATFGASSVALSHSPRASSRASPGEGAVILRQPEGFLASSEPRQDHRPPPRAAE
jgi:hypothetical protein